MNMYILDQEEHYC